MVTHRDWVRMVQYLDTGRETQPGDLVYCVGVRGNPRKAGADVERVWLLPADFTLERVVPFAISAPTFTDEQVETLRTALGINQLDPSDVETAVQRFVNAIIQRSSVPTVKKVVKSLDALEKIAHSLLAIMYCDLELRSSRPPTSKQIVAAAAHLELDRATLKKRRELRKYIPFPSHLMKLQLIEVAKFAHQQSNRLAKATSRRGPKGEVELRAFLTDIVRFAIKVSADLKLPRHSELDEGKSSALLRFAEAVLTLAAEWGVEQLTASPMFSADASQEATRVLSGYRRKRNRQVSEHLERITKALVAGSAGPR